MDNHVRTAVFVALFVCLASIASAEESAKGTDVQEGQRLALKICTACHIVSLDQSDAPILQPPAPSFHVIANRRQSTAESLRNFLATTHTTIKTPLNMPNPQLSDDQVGPIVGYILSLRRGP